MAAPTPTTRGVPSGVKLQDGFPFLITFASALTVGLWECSGAPPGVDGGPEIEQTTMLQVLWRTFAMRKLKTLTPMTSEYAFDPKVYSTIVSLINNVTTVTLTFSDTSTVCFFGALRVFTPGTQTEGAQPRAQATVVATNFDPVGKVEAGPVYTSPGGTVM